MIMDTIDYLKRGQSVKQWLADRGLRHTWLITELGKRDIDATDSYLSYTLSGRFRSSKARELLSVAERVMREYDVKWGMV